MVRVWEVATEREVSRLVWEDSFLAALAFAADGKTLAVSAGGQWHGPSRITLWDVPSATRRTTLERPGRAATCLAFAPDGRALAAATPGVEVWDLASGKSRTLSEKEEPPGPGRPGGAIPQPAGPDLTPFLPQSLAFAADGNSLAVASGGTVRVWDLGSDRRHRRKPRRRSANGSRNGVTCASAPAGSRRRG
jgi:WD40 repeat protein